MEQFDPLAFIRRWRWQAAMVLLAALIVIPSGCSLIWPREARIVPGQLKSPSVLVEKSARRLTLFDDGKVVKTYRVCTGVAPGDKQVEGDKRTPEGDFYICYKNPESKFTLSLGLSYPNAEDAARGLRDNLITREQHDGIVRAIAATSQPDWYTPLGGEIMIHGAGSDREGTAGCIGMDDDDIRELYPILPIGTPVTIRP